MMSENQQTTYKNSDNNCVRGNLKIFIGYSPGVGKTYTMLNEANRRFRRGENIVIGFLETHSREETSKQIGDLEIIPSKKVNYSGIESLEMDVDAILARSPDIVLIDELAHENPSTFRNRKRYEDVEEILNKGINVITTLNIQHLESINDTVYQITGILEKETIPDSIVETADEVVVVDVTPDALLNRLNRGNIYPIHLIDRPLKNYYRKGNLNALREIALRQTAQEVDEDLEEYMKEHGIKESWQTVERVMVCISSGPSAKKLIRRGARVAKRYKCEWTVVNVCCTHPFAKKLTDYDKVMLESHFKLAKQLGAELVTLTGKSISGELLSFAEEKHITIIIIGHATRSKLETFVRGSTVLKLLKKAKDTSIYIIPG